MVIREIIFLLLYSILYIILGKYKASAKVRWKIVRLPLVNTLTVYNPDVHDGTIILL